MLRTRLNEISKWVVEMRHCEGSFVLNRYSFLPLLLSVAMLPGGIPACGEDIQPLCDLGRNKDRFAGQMVVVTVNVEPGYHMTWVKQGGCSAKVPLEFPPNVQSPPPWEPVKDELWQEFMRLFRDRRVRQVGEGHRELIATLRCRFDYLGEVGKGLERKNGYGDHGRYDMRLLVKQVLAVQLRPLK